MNTVFVKTTKAEREGANLSNNLFRVLSLINGESSSDELAKRAAPSLRKTWDELLGELLRGGYVVENHEAVPDQNNALQELASEAKQKAEKAARAAELKAYFATAKEKARVEAEQAAHNDALLHAKLEATAAVAKASSNAEAKAKTGAKQKEENAAHARAELEAAVAAAKIKTDALALAKAEARQKEEESARARAEFEATILAAKTGPGSCSMDRAVAGDTEIAASEVARLRNLETENETLKKLLAEACVEIALLKNSRKY